MNLIYLVAVALLAGQEPASVELTFATTTEATAYPGAMVRRVEEPTTIVVHSDGGRIRRGSRECSVDLESREMFEIDHYARKYFRLSLPFSLAEQFSDSESALLLDLAHQVSAEVTTERRSEPERVGDWATTAYLVKVDLANGTRFVFQTARADLPQVDLLAYRQLVEHCASLRLEEDWTSKILDLGGIAIEERSKRTSPGGAILESTSRLESIEVEPQSTDSFRPPESYEERSEPYVKFVRP